MNISSRDDKPDPFVPACLFLTAIYDPTIELLMDRTTSPVPALHADEEATEKRAVVWSKLQSSPRDNLITFFNRMSYLASIVIEVSIERDCSWQETMEAWQDGR
jgi:hypothetical protein